MFEKGHKFAKGGKRAGAGRKKSLNTLMQESLETIDQNIPALIDKLIGRALDGDREALMYCLDRRLGKPKASTEIDVTGDIGITARQVMLLLDEAKREFLEQSKQYQLKEGSNNVEGV